MSQEFTPQDDICVIVPAFNEAHMLAQVLTELRSHFTCVICVDDGSTDGSSAAAAAAGAWVLRHPVNLGQGAALWTGIEFALSRLNAQWIVTFDADGQHDVHDAVRMLSRAQIEDVDVVLGSRFVSQASCIPARRRFLLRLAVAFTRRTTGLRVTDTHNGLRVFSRGAAQQLELKQAGMAHASEILSIVAQRGLTFVEEPVTIRYSDYSISKGQSNLNAINILHDLVLARLRAAG